MRVAGRSIYLTLINVRKAPSRDGMVSDTFNVVDKE